MRSIVRLSAAMLAVTVIGLLFIGLRASVPNVPSNNWTPTGDMDQARAGASGALMYDGRVLITGGRDASGAVSLTAERYSPEGGQFLPTPPMMAPRANHTSTLLPDGRVLVVGGMGTDGRAIVATEIYDPVTNSWSSGAPLNHARAGHTATALYDGRIVIAGGDDAGLPIASIEVYDPDGGTFTLSNVSLSTARTGQGASLLPDGSVFIAGGFDGTNLLASVDVYDPWADSVSAAAPLTTARMGHSVTALLSGKVLVAGGAGATGELASAEVYDPSSNTFTPTSNLMISPRQRHQAILLPHNNQVLIVGGTFGSSAVTTAEVYVAWVGNGGTFFQTNPPATARAWAAASALSFPAGLTIRTGPNDGLALLAGGSPTSDASNPVKSAELYGFATVKTDKADYAPGSTVTITGSGWQPAETVTLTLVEDPLIDTHGPYTVVADGSGNIIDTTFVPDEHDLNVTFYLTATGSQSQAQTRFTDATHVGSITVGAQTGLLTYGTAGFATYAVTVTGAGSGGVTVTLGVTGLPAGASGSFSPASVTVNNSTSAPSTLTITTSASAPAATTTFSVTNNDNGTTGSGTLAIGKRPISVTAATNTKTYDSATSAAGTPTVTSGTLAAGDTGTFTETYDTKNAGTGKTLTPAGTIKNSGNTDVTASYSITFQPVATGVITARALTVTAATNTRTYDATTSAAAVPTITSGTLQGTDAANFTETYDTKNVGTGKTLTPAGTATDGNAGANYTYTFVNNTTGVINARALTVTAATNTKTYDATTSAAATPTITSGVLQGTDTANFSEVYNNNNVGTGKTLTPSGTVNDGNAGANYTYTFVNNATGVINARGLTVAAATNTKAYDGTTSAAATPTISVGVLQGTDTANFTEVYSNKNVGTGKTLTPSGTVNDGNAGANYTYTFVNNTTGVINASALTVTAATNTKAYDGTTTAAATPTITSGTLQGTDTAGFTETYVTKNAGTGKTLTPSGTVTDGNSGNNYTYTFVADTTGVITARAITVTAATNTKTYDGTTTAAATPTITSGTLAAGDTSSFTETYDTKHAGTGKTLTPAGTATDGNGGGNYTVTFVTNTTGVINARALTVTAATNTKAYDATTSAAATPTITSGVLQGTDTANFSEVYSNKNAGTGKTLTPSGTVNDGNAGADYTYTFVNNATGVINARGLTVTAATNTKAYDGTTSAAATPTISAGVLQGTDTANFTEVYSNKNVGTNKTLTPSGTVSDGNGGANYTLTFANNTTGVITALPLTVTAATNTKAYDGTTSAAAVPTITSGTLQGTDTAGFTETYDTKNVGTGKTLTPSGTVTDGNSGNNYTYTFVADTTGVITARAITVTAATNTKTYDGTTTAAATPTITSGTLAAGDTSSFTETYDTKHAGTGKTLTPAGTANDGNGGGNYAVTFVTNTTGVINARALTVTAATNTKTYDATTSAAATPTITSGVLQGTDTANFSEVYSNKNAGTGKTLTPSGTVNDGNAGADYTYTFVNNTTGVINAQALTVTAATNTKTYDATTSAAAVPTITSGALQDSDTANFIEVYSNKNAGTGKTLTASGTVTDGNSGNNYTYIFVSNTTGVITARALTVTAATNTKTYDATTSAAAVPTITSGTLQGADTASFTEIYDTKNVGTGKTLTPSGTVTDGNSGNNYTYTFVANTTGVINARALTVTAATNTKTYDGTTTAAATPTITSGALQDSETASFTETYDTKNAGTGKTLTPAGAVNDGNGGNNYSYTFITNTTGVVTAKSLSVTGITANNKVYDATTTASLNLGSAALAGVLAPDIVTLNTGGASGAFATANAGNGILVTVSGLTLGGADAGNYSVTQPTTTANITKATPTVTVTGATFTYDGNAHAATAIATGVGGANVAGNFAFTYTPPGDSTTPTNAGTYSVDAGFTSTNSNYSNTSGSGSITINKLTPTFTNLTASQAITYGTSTISVSGRVTGYAMMPGTVTIVIDGVTSAPLGLNGNPNNFSDTTFDTHAIAAGPHTITYTYSGDSNANSASDTSTTLTVNPKPASVTANSTSKTYGGTVTFAGTEFTTSGLINGDAVSSVTLTSAGAAATATVAGSPYSIVPSAAVGTGLSNYTISYVNGTLTVNPKAASVTANSTSKTYGGTLTFAGTEFTTSGLVNGDAVASVTLTSAGASASATVAGSPYSIVPSTAVGTGLSNYTISYVNGTLTVNPATASVTPNAASKTYGTADPAFTGTLSGFLAADGVTASYSRTAGETVAGGPYAISATLSPAGVLGNYTITYNTANFTITPATASVTPNAASKTYSTADPAFTGTLTGFLAADGVTASYSRTAGETVAGSPYAISATLSPAGMLGNYTITYNTANFTITPATASVTPNAASKTYGAADPAFTGTLSGFLAADGVTASYSRTAGETVAGSPYAISATLSPAGVLGNYTITYNTANFTITPAALSVTANSKSKTYGGPDPIFDVSYSGFVNGDTASVVSGTPVFNFAGQPPASYGPSTIVPTNAATYAVRPSGLSSGNYAITYHAGTYTITPAMASVTPNAASKTYGTADPTLTGTLTGFLAADGVTASYSRTAGETVAGSPYAISATLSPAGVLGNYTITYNTANFTITPATASVTPNAASKTYGAADPTLTGTLTGFLAADGVTASYSRTAGETVAGGPYAISATLSPAGVLGNYTITYNTANFTITPAALSVTANSTSKTYGGPDPIFDVSYSGFVNGDTASVVSGTPVFNFAGQPPASYGPSTIVPTNAATYAVRPSGLSSGNYAITYHAGTYTITPAMASVTPNAASKTYGTADPAFTGTLTGFLAADGVTASYSRTAGETVAGSPYAISVTLSPAGVLGNYTITYNTANFTITPATASVTPNAASKTYGAADPAFTGTLSGFLAADGVTASYSRTAGETVAGSPYAISATLSPAGVLGNYTITYNTANFTITPAALSVTANSKSKTYGGPDPIFDVSYSGFVNGDTASVVSGTPVFNFAGQPPASYGPSTIVPTNAATYAVRPSGLSSGNYAITYHAGTYTITPAMASVTPNAASKTYGTADPAFTGTLSGFLAADGVTASYSRTAGETVAGSPYAISATLSPAGVLGNYTITYNTANFTITPAALSVTANSTSKTYGGADPAFDVSYSGFVNGDTASAVSGTPVFNFAGQPPASYGPSTIVPTNVATYAVRPSGLSSGNYAITYHAGTYTITPAAASVTPNAASKTYGTADPAFTGTLTGFLAADGVTASYSRTAGETVAGSPYTISATLSPAGVLGNYTITYNTANFTITPATASVTPNAASKTYGAADPTLTGTLTGFLAADGVTASYSRTAGETVAGGPYAISATLSPAGVLGNYTITYNTANFTITPAALSVTANSTSKTYGGADPAFDVSYSGFVNGDTASVVSGTPVFNFAGQPPASYGPSTIVPTNAATYAVRPSGLSSGNYAITYHAGTYTISPATASVTPNAASKTYGTADPAFTGTLSGFLAADGVTASYSRTAGETVAGGPYAISATLSPAGVLGNYTITYNTANFTITPATASVTPNAASKTYGAADPTLTGTLTGFLAADGVTASYSRTAGETVAGGPYAISATLSPAGVLGNYTISYNTANFTINKAHLTVTADDKSRFYGAANPAFTATLSGFKNGETLGTSGVAGSASFSGTGPSSTGTTVPGAYVITPAVGSLTATNYDFTPLVDGTLTINPATATTGTLIVIKHVINDNGGTALAGNFWLTVTGNGASPASFWGSETGTAVTLNAGASYNVTESGPRARHRHHVGDSDNDDDHDGFNDHDHDGPRPRRQHHAGDGDRDDDHDGYCDDYHAHDHDGGDDHDSHHDGHDDHGDDYDGHHDGDHHDDDDDDNPVIYIGSYSTDCVGTILAGQTRTCTITNDDFRGWTATQGSWGAAPRGNNTGALLANNFATVYPNAASYPKIGSGSKVVTFTSATKIDRFLPAGGQAKKPLSTGGTDPTSTDAGIFAGQVLALRLNVDFSNAGIVQAGLANLKIAPGNTLAGKRVAEVLAYANIALGGGALPAGISSIAQLNDVVTDINENFDGNSNHGLLIP